MRGTGWKPSHSFNLPGDVLGNLKAPSMNLQAIREKRAAKIQEARALADAAQSQGRQMTPEEIQAFDTIKAAIQGLEAEEARAAFLTDMERRSQGAPVDHSHSSLVGRVNVLEVLRAGMEGRSLSGAAAEYHAEAERRTGRKAQGFFVPLEAIERRADPVDTAMAGAITPVDYRADQYVEPFRNALLARKLGVRVLSGLSGNVNIPKHGTGTTVGWVAEGGTLPDGEFEPESVILAPKHAGGTLEMSRQLIQQSSPDIEKLVNGDLSALLAQAIDSALIKGGGTNEPQGILAGAGVQVGSLATLDWPAVLAVLEKLELANCTPNAVLASIKVKTKLAQTLREAGLPGYLWDAGKVGDLAAYATNQVPNAGAALGTAIFGDFTQAMLGIWSEIDLLVNPYAEGPYKRGGVLVRAMSTVDVALRHPEAFVKVQDVAI